MFFLRIRGFLITWVFILCFSCGGGKSLGTDTNNFPARKAYVVIRSEGGPQNVQRFRNTLATDFSENNVRTEYSLYRAKQAWNQNEIFNTAYKGEYDYIILIDQVAKITIDNKTQVGGKYQIRSYHVKSPNPDWLDLGQSTCNLSVVPSIQKFSREVIRSIVGNQAAFKGHGFKLDEDIASNGGSNTLDKAESSKEVASEIEILRNELEEEKRKTRLAQDERRKLENQLKLELEAQKQKAKLAQIEAADIALKKRQRQREIAEEYAAKREEIKSRETTETPTEPVVVAVVSAEPTREERLSQREETKRLMAEEKAAKRKEIAEAAATRKEERKQLEKLEKEERRRLKEELEAQRKEKERLDEEDLKRIKEKVAQERRQAEELASQKKEAERLSEERLKEEKRQAEILEAELNELSRIEKEQAAALAIEQRKTRRIAREEEAKRQEATLQAQRSEEKRQAELRLAELQKQEQQRLDNLKREVESIAAQEKEAQQLVDLKRQEQERLAEQKRVADALVMQREEQVRLANVQRLEEQQEVQRLADQRRAEQERLDEQLKRDAALAKQQEEQVKLDTAKRLQDQKDQEALEAQEKENVRLAAETKKAKPKKKSANNSKSSSTNNVSSSPNVFVVIRGNTGDRIQFEDLEDHIEFDFMFAKAKSKTTILGLDQSVSLADIISRTSDEHNMIILVDQKEYLGDGKSTYEIKIMNKQTDKDWNNASSQAFNLNVRADLKRLSKKITEYL